MTSAPATDVLPPVGLHLVTTQVACELVRVLVICTDDAPVELLKALHGQGLAVLLVPGLPHAGALADVDVVLLDLHRDAALADLQVLRACSSLPVVVVLREPEVEPLLADGADECIAAGVPAAVVAQRLRALLRRRALPSASEVITCGQFVLDTGRHVFVHAGAAVHLPPKEFGLLALLMRKDGRVVSRGEALERVWGQRARGDLTTVDVHVKRLRSKLEPDPGRPRHVLTVRGLGYRFEG